MRKHLTVDELTDLIAQHDNAYWDAGRPTITDREYDELVKQLQDMQEEELEVDEEDSYASVVYTDTFGVEHTTCPTCRAPATRNGMSIICSEPKNCRLKCVKMVQKYCRKKHITGFTAEILYVIHDAGLLETPADLYKLTAQDFTYIKNAGIGQQTVTKLLNQLKKSKKK